MAARLEVVLATANIDKAREIMAVLEGPDGPGGVELQPRPVLLAEVDETGETVEENARLKAVAVCEHTGRPALADDTALEVRALDGRPGVRSARYAGEAATYADNVAKLLDELDGEDDRRARFRTVALVRFPDGEEVVGEGHVDGRIATAARGEHGFGYDPVFVPDGGDGRTFAEMTAEEKHALSHRGRAVRALSAKLRRRLGGW